jgi:hypothetical protein
LKKKLAPNLPFVLKSLANVRQTVDFPVPAIPFNQNIDFPFGDWAQATISLRRSTLVFGKHSSSY